jgi:hypothetical protein
MSLPGMPFWLVKLLWRFQKKRDAGRKLNDAQGAALAEYYTKATNLFRALNIDVDAKPAEVRKRYYMMLMYLDKEEYICPAAARTATLIGYLDTLGSGWQLPPTSVSVSKEFAEEVDGYLAVELLRNHLGLNDIRTELVTALNRRAAEVKGSAPS